MKNYSLYRSLLFCLVLAGTVLVGQVSIRQSPAKIPTNNKIIWNLKGYPVGSWSNTSLSLHDQFIEISTGFTINRVQTLRDNLTLAIASFQKTGAPTRQDHYYLIDHTGEIQFDWEWTSNFDIGYPRVTAIPENRYLCTYPEDQRVKIVNTNGEVISNLSLTPESDWNHEKRLLIGISYNENFYITGMLSVDLTRSNNVYLTKIKQFIPLQTREPISIPLTVLYQVSFSSSPLVAISGTAGTGDYRQEPRLIIYNLESGAIQTLDWLPKKMLWSGDSLITLSNRKIHIVYPDNNFTVDEYIFPLPVIPIALRNTEHSWVAIYANSVSYSNGTLTYQDLYFHIQPKNNPDFNHAQIRHITDGPVERISLTPESSTKVSVQLDDEIYHIVGSD